MRKATSLPVLLMVFATACSSASAQSDSTPAPASAAAFDPTGFYDFEATLGIEVRTGTLEFERNAEGHLVGEAWLEGEGDPAIIESVVVSGNHVDAYAFVNGSTPVTFALDFTGSAFSGTIDAGGQSIAVDGQRRAQ